MKNAFYSVMMTTMLFSFTMNANAQTRIVPGGNNSTTQQTVATDGYSVIGAKVMYNGKEVKNADAKTFTILGYGYAKDKNRVYLYGTELQYVDATSFRLKTGNGNYGNNQQGGYNGYGQQGGYITERPNRNNGYGFGNGNYGNYGMGHNYGAAYKVSGNVVYFNGQRVKSAYASSFVDLGYGYGRDKYYAYFYGEKISGSQGSSFKVLDYGYSVDKYNVYFYGEKVKGAYASSFQVLGGGYAIDKYYVYFYGEKMNGVSKSSFRVDGNGYAHDNIHYYYNGKKTR